MIRGIIYKAISPSGKSYFGKTTKTLNRRIQYHHQKSKNPRFHFPNAIKKYGINNFLWETVETFEKESMEELQKILNERESFWIQKEKTYLREYGYNMTFGGEGLAGRKLSDEHKRKISKSEEGRVFSEELKNKLKENWNLSHFNTGKNPSRDKLREKSLNVQKIKCEHCEKEFTPWGLSNHFKKLNTII